jgi:formylglycine-generating enzyme required for sulfatase activity
MQSALQSAGFDVTVATDATLPALLSIIESSFAAKINRGDTCLVYYSGYAVQFNEDNYLIPVEYDASSSGRISNRAYSVSRLVQDLEDRGAGLKMILLESARSAPIPQASQPGLAVPDFGDTSQIVYATAAPPGQVSHNTSDGDIGVFTNTIAKAISQPGSDVIQVFRSAQDTTRNLGQEIFYLSRASERFYFKGPVSAGLPTAPTFRVGVPATNQLDREEYVWIPPGTFRMGCVPSDTHCKSEEQPQHQVTLTKGFWLGRNEVQVQSYRRYIEAQHQEQLQMPTAPLDNRGWKKSDYPVVDVHWDNANSYCRWAGGRLPTEAEWEYAARGGIPDQTFPFGSEDNARDKANFRGRQGNDIYSFTAPVRRFDPNGFGLYDMFGNVSEWVADFFSPQYYTVAPAIDTHGPAQGKTHTVRGGSWVDSIDHLRISFRETSGRGNDVIGFRCAIDDTPENRKLLGASH